VVEIQKGILLYGRADGGLVGKSADSHGTGPWFEYQSRRTIFPSSSPSVPPSIGRPAIKGVLKRLKNVVVSTVEEKYLSPRLGALQKAGTARYRKTPQIIYILLYSCHIVRKFLNIDTEHKTQKSQNVEARRR
jgi:hypothetical protein